MEAASMELMQSTCMQYSASSKLKAIRNNSPVILCSLLLAFFYSIAEFSDYICFILHVFILNNT